MIKSLKPFLASKKTLLGGIVSFLGALLNLVEHLYAVSNGAPLSIERISLSVAGFGAAFSGFASKDADKTGVPK
jgi:hypothetical protein